jgi:hypothetical protein
MKFCIATGIFVTALLICSCSSLNDIYVENGYYRITLQKVNWVLLLPEEHFTLKQSYLDNEMYRAYYVLRDFNSGMNAYISIERNREYNDTKTYLENKWNTRSANLPKAINVKQTDTEECSILTYIIPEELNKGNFNIIYKKEDIFIDVHLSKLNFSSDDLNKYNSIFKAISFSTKPQKK